MYKYCLLGQILSELKELSEKKIPAPFDYVRRKYLAELQQYTKRNIVLYATSWTPRKPGVPPEFVSISNEDIQGFMEVFNDLPDGSLDLILHSPGGSAESTEAIVSYIRSKFNDVRVFVPHAAMSAATMLACSCDRVVMGKHSFLGPIDPQMILNTPLGNQSVPVQAILDQFDRAKEDCQDPKLLGAWIPMLSRYGPALLVQCDEALDLSKELVSNWLEQYMFKSETNKKLANKKAKKIADSLASHTTFKTHGRFLNREQLRNFGLLIDGFEDDPKLRDLVLSVFHSTMHTFGGTTAVKIIENHLGRAYVRQFTIVARQPVSTKKPSPPKT